MRALIAGGTGDIGQRLIPELLAHDYEVTVLSRRPIRPPSLPRKVNFVQWDGKTSRGWVEVVEETDAVINLAGAGIADKRWTDNRKVELLNSRLEPGRAVVEAIDKAKHKPAVLIQSSASGYYGSWLNNKILTEESGPGDDYLANLCVQWESATEPVLEMGVRRVIIRTAPVLDPEGEMLPRVTLPFKLFVGGPVGSGRQWLSWIHWLDQVRATRFLIENEQANGPVNLTAPNPVQNREFGKIIGKTLGRPAFWPVPSFVVQALFGELSRTVLYGQRVLPVRLQELGFKFKFPGVEAALRDLLLNNGSDTGEVKPPAEQIAAQ
jgi:uncharacterized protein (TIGR01777 family)